MQAGAIAEAEGAAAITLHARPADQPYTTTADWLALQRLVAHVSLPVVGNGGVWEAADALHLMRSCPGLAGVMVGRPAMGRPWLFSEIR
jgi:tRNA-dihydrouridine synthase